MSHDLWLFGRNGYFNLAVDSVGQLRVPDDSRSAKRFGAHAPWEVLRAGYGRATFEVLGALEEVVRQKWQSAVVGQKETQGEDNGNR